jgi:hypothetical protein
MSGRRLLTDVADETDPRRAIPVRPAVLARDALHIARATTVDIAFVAVADSICTGRDTAPAGTVADLSAAALISHAIDARCRIRHKGGRRHLMAGAKCCRPCLKCRGMEGVFTPACGEYGEYSHPRHRPHGRPPTIPGAWNCSDVPFLTALRRLRRPRSDGGRELLTSTIAWSKLSTFVIPTSPLQQHRRERCGAPCARPCPWVLAASRAEERALAAVGPGGRDAAHGAPRSLRARAVPSPELAPSWTSRNPRFSTVSFVRIAAKSAGAGTQTHGLWMRKERGLAAARAREHRSGW